MTHFTATNAKFTSTPDIFLFYIIPIVVVIAILLIFFNTNKKSISIEENDISINKEEIIEMVQICYELGEEINYVNTQNSDVFEKFSNIESDQLHDNPNTNNNLDGEEIRPPAAIINNQEEYRNRNLSNFNERNSVNKEQFEITLSKCQSIYNTVDKITSEFQSRYNPVSRYNIYTNYSPIGKKRCSDIETLIYKEAEEILNEFYAESYGKYTIDGIYKELSNEMMENSRKLNDFELKIKSVHGVKSEEDLICKANELIAVLYESMNIYNSYLKFRLKYDYVIKWMIEDNIEIKDLNYSEFYSSYKEKMESVMRKVDDIILSVCNIWEIE